MRNRKRDLRARRDERGGREIEIGIEEAMERSLENTILFKLIHIIFKLIIFCTLLFILEKKIISKLIFFPTVYRKISLIPTSIFIPTVQPNGTLLSLLM
jgi:hypothetical protein